MQATLFFCLVPARSIGNIESPSKVSRKDIVQSPNYAKLLKLLKNRERKFYDNDDDDSSSDENIDDIKRKREQLTLANRRHFLLPLQRGSRRTRPSHTYGQKSHWDTLFG
ncbi:unnamed protein product [Rotaria sp. Silwood2]|nr:unnamed protein product [Rotaria sp. Silwood2]CAF2723925.1 unnamed protein product [Rotaria sp. Silwood2]CAF2950669.1 unnamed protein product [Rotaria sp. Silwood2]CAF3182721.1 unnamed protein product [Rotaria sp. Silwood2]CAF3914060.1 unnamed protein product [Rotaria sp. Silwood2]